MEINPDNLGHLTSTEFNKIIKDLCNEEQLKHYRKVYNFFRSLSLASDDLFPLSEDIDKARAIKYHIAKLLHDGKELSFIFSTISQLVIDYDVVDSELLEKYKYINDQIYKLVEL